MARNRQPPSPAGQDIKSWAAALTGYLRDTIGDDDETTPVVVLLAHRLPSRDASAKTRGALMYDTVLDAPVMSNGADWVRVMTAASLLSNTNCVTVSGTVYTPAVIPDAQVRLLALALQEVILRLNSIERR